MPRTRLIAAGVLALAAVFASPGAAPGQAGATTPDTLSLSADLRVRVREGRTIEIETRLAPGEGFETAAARIAGARSLAATIAQANDGVVPADGWVKAPLAAASDVSDAIAVDPRDLGRYLMADKTRDVIARAMMLADG